MVWLPDGEEIEDIFTPFDKIHKCDGQTQRHRMTAKAALAQHRLANNCINFNEL